MKRVSTAVLAAAVLWAGAAFAQSDSQKLSGLELPELPKLQAVPANLESQPAKAEAAPGRPQPAPKPALDVSRMPFDAESIRQVVKHHMPEIQECYEKVLAETGKKIQGRVVVGFIIDVEGNVLDARILGKKSTVKDDRIHGCVLSMRTWLFPKPSDNRNYPIEYPFDLKVSK